MLTYILAAIIVLLAIAIISAGVKVVPQSETRVIRSEERRVGKECRL